MTNLNNLIINQLIICKYPNILFQAAMSDRSVPSHGAVRTPLNEPEPYCGYYQQSIYLYLTEIVDRSRFQSLMLDRTERERVQIQRWI